MGCADSHAEGTPPETGGDLNVVPDAGVAMEGLEPPVRVTDDVTIPVCGAAEAEEGRVQATLSSYDLGNVPLDLRVTCQERDGMLMVSATDGLSNLHLEVAFESNASTARATASMEFESLATFEGGCTVCTDADALAGTLRCSTLLWDAAEEPVKASLAGSFRCP